MRTTMIAAVTLVAGVLAGGCGTAIQQGITPIATANLPKSKYYAAYATEDGVDAYLATLKTADKKVVRDETGVYYNEVRGNLVYSVYLNKEDEVALKDMLSTAVGLMEPVYSFDDQGEPVFDAAETARRHTYLTKTVGLKLLPLDVTRKYHAQVEARAREDAARTLGQTSSTLGMLTQGASITSGAYAGELTLYNSEFYSKMLVPLGAEASYVIHDPMTEHFLRGLTNQAMMAKLHPQARADYERDRWVNTGVGASIAKSRGAASLTRFDIVPVVYYKTLKGGGAYRAHSGCRAWSAEGEKQAIREFRRYSDVAYASAIAASFQDRQQSSIDAVKQRFQTFRAELPAKRRESEAACLAGLRALDVGGVLSSKRLR